jgi:hypothetical protein
LGTVTGAVDSPVDSGSGIRPAMRPGRRAKTHAPDGKRHGHAEH